MPLINLAGQRFGRLKVVSRAANGNGHNTRWLCVCDCGTQRIVHRAVLLNGKTVSCGCWRKTLGSVYNRTHGMSDRPEYAIWCGMIKRCYNKKDKRYERYGGRGITVCDGWRKSFVDFFADMGQRPSDSHTIERIDNDIGYAPGNCRWAGQSEQQNNRCNNRHITFRGVTKTVAQWASALQMQKGTLHNRIQSGWDIERALTTPVKTPTRG